MSALPPLFAALPPELLERFDPQAPWTLLDALDELFARLPSQSLAIRLSPDVHLIGDRIVIGKGTRVGPGAVLEGPLRIGADCEIRAGCTLRGGVWIGDGCVVGTSTEVKRAIFLDGARAPHLNYVGDSILGAGVNLGAGTILSNFRHDAGEIRIPLADGTRLATGRRKLGAILGDGVLTGCNAVLHPGTIVGRETEIYPGAQLRPGVYPAASIVKLRQELEIVDKRTGGPAQAGATSG